MDWLLYNGLRHERINCINCRDMGRGGGSFIDFSIFQKAQLSLIRLYKIID